VAAGASERTLVRAELTGSDRSTSSVIPIRATAASAAATRRNGSGTSSLFELSSESRAASCAGRQREAASQEDVDVECCRLSRQWTQGGGGTRGGVSEPSRQRLRMIRSWLAPGMMWSTPPEKAVVCARSVAGTGEQSRDVSPCRVVAQVSATRSLQWTGTLRAIPIRDPAPAGNRKEPL